MNKKPLRFSNEEALLVLASGNPEAFSIVLGNFSNFFRKYIGRILATSNAVIIDYDDLEMIAQRAFFVAIKNYKMHHAPFAAFSKTIIQNALMNAVTQQQTPTAMMTNNAQSLDAPVFEDNSSLLMGDIVGQTDPYSDKDSQSRASVDHIGDLSLVNLTKMEINVVVERLKGYTYEEIASKFGLKRREVTAIMESIRRKFIEAGM